MPFLFNNANMFIDQYKGIIGIGTNTPTSNLHVIGSSLITGNLVVSGFTSISSVSFSSSISLTGLTVTGTGITGTLNTASQPNITSVGTLTGLSVTGTGITGTLNTASQPNITSVGTLTGLSVAGTGITGTLNTATQNNITSVGTLTGLSVTGTGITGTLNTASQNNITSVGTLTGLTVAGTGITGTLNTASQNNITSVGTLTGLTVTGTGITGTLNTASQPNVTTVGTLTRLAVTSNLGIGTTNPTCNLHVVTSATTLPTTGVTANIGGMLAILHGYNDGFGRFISALDLNMTATSVRYIAWGQHHSALNSAEIGFYYAGSGSVNNYLRLGLMNQAQLFCTGSGYVGIGITNPSYPFQVLTAGTTYSGTNKYYWGQSNTGTALLAAGSGSTNVSAVFQGDVINVAGNYVAYSDIRIKKDIVSLDTNYCLKLLLQLRVVEHDYIDTFKYPKKKINFIAQEVQKVIPLAIDSVSEYIPSIFNKYSYYKINEKKYCITDIHFDFITLGTKIKVLTEKEDFITTVINLTDNTITIQTEKELIGEIFVYGHSIDDCLTLNNDTLYTICVGAVQENSKRITQLEKQLRILEEKINKLI